MKCPTCNAIMFWDDDFEELECIDCKSKLDAAVVEMRKNRGDYFGK